MLTNYDVKNYIALKNKTNITLSAMKNLMM